MSAFIIMVEKATAREQDAITNGLTALEVGWAHEMPFSWQVSGENISVRELDKLVLSAVGSDRSYLIIEASSIDDWSARGTKTWLRWLKTEM